MGYKLSRISGIDGDYIRTLIAYRRVLFHVFEEMIPILVREPPALACSASSRASRWVS